MKLKKILENLILEKTDVGLASDYMQHVMLSSGISATAVDDMMSILSTMSDSEILNIRKKFQTMTMDEYINGGWTTFKDFFNAKGTKTGTGRGELMAVMAIEGASSGGQEEKDLKIDGVGTYEVKEDPDSIRMAKSGFSGLFEYVTKIKAFYKLLTALEVNDSSNDSKLLENLKLAFNSQEIAEEIFKILTVNFRGDGFKSSKSDKESDEPAVDANNFFIRSAVAAELPTGVIQLQFDGFESLKNKRDVILKNSDLIKNAKMLVKFKDSESEYWISGDDAEELKNAKPNSEVSIKKGINANQKEFKVFMYNLIELFKHPYTVNPLSISKDFSERKAKYFGEVIGVLYYMEGDPRPYIGTQGQFVIYGISQNMGKLRRKRSNEPAWIANQT